MNWLKDNLIAVLGVACLVLGLGWSITYYVQKAALATAKADLTVATNNLGAAREANSTNQAAIALLKATNQRIIDENRANVLAAAEAEGRLKLVRAELGRQAAENARLREELAKENPDVGAYLADGMPCELAEQLWGKDGYCSD